MKKELLLLFLDFCWESFLKKRTPQTFLDELDGMDSVRHGVGELATSFVATTFYTLANMPADPVNIVDMLEQGFDISSNQDVLILI